MATCSIGTYRTYIMYRTLKERFYYISARASPKETVMASASLANFKKSLKTLISVLYQNAMVMSRMHATDTESVGDRFSHCVSTYQ